MMTEFSGRDEFVARLDSAVQLPSVEEITSGVQDTLIQLIRAGSIKLPEALKQPCGNHYARRLLYRSADHEYTVIAMIWGPCQGTPLHDHAGVWCVEGVLEGEIDVTQYDLLEQQDDRCQFKPLDTVRTGIGSAGSLIPPFEYHTIANARDDACSITVHVYGGELEECSIFEGGTDGWYHRQTKHLSYH